MYATGVIIILVAVLYVLFWIAVSAGIVYLFILIVKALKKYVNSKEVREEKKAVAKSLGEALKENRIRCQMTQEFVAETLGVSRQSVSKWENGSSDPNTSNLIALSKLYKIFSGGTVGMCNENTGGRLRFLCKGQSADKTDIIFQPEKFCHRGSLFGIIQGCSFALL